MMTNYRIVSAVNRLAFEWKLGSSSDTVTISIYNMTTNTLEVNGASMTNETGGLFSYAWTPTTEGTYRIDYYNQTLDTHDFEMATVVSESNALYLSGVTL